MTRKIEREARKWALGKIRALGIDLPDNVPYERIKNESMKHADEITGTRIVFDKYDYESGPLLVFLYNVAVRREEHH